MLPVSLILGLLALPANQPSPLAHAGHPAEDASVAVIRSAMSGDDLLRGSRIDLVEDLGAGMGPGTSPVTWSCLWYAAGRGDFRIGRFDAFRFRVAKSSSRYFDDTFLSNEGESAVKGFRLFREKYRYAAYLEGEHPDGSKLTIYLKHGVLYVEQTIPHSPIGDASAPGLTGGMPAYCKDDKWMDRNWREAPQLCRTTACYYYVCKPKRCARATVSCNSN